MAAMEAGGGCNLMSVPDEKLKGIKLNPIDVQGIKLVFVQFYSRFVLEAQIAKDPDVTPEKISMFRGGGLPIENWLANNVYNKEPEGKDNLDKALDILGTLEAASFVAEPIKGVTRSGGLLVFADRVEKAQSSQ